MSKAILILPEMYDRCKECPLKFSNGYGILCAPEDKYIKLESEERPDFCPLRPMPEYERLGYGESWVGGYKTGWNDALNAVEGSREDAPIH